MHAQCGLLTGIGMSMFMLGTAYADGPSFEGNLSGGWSAVFDMEDNFVPGGTSSEPPAALRCSTLAGIPPAMYRSAEMRSRLD